MDTQRTAIVTGGTRGIGAAVTAALSARGTHVLAVYTRDDAAAATLAERLAGAPGSVVPHRADVADPDGVQGALDACVGRWGRVDHLVNNAGVMRDARLREMSLAVWQEVLAVDLTGVFLMTQAALRVMVPAGWGRIVTIGSVAGEMGSVYQANYAAAKGGLVGLTRSAARDGARHGVTANLVVLGPIATEGAASVPPDRVENIVGGVPLQRMGTPEEAAHAVLFLLDEQAAFVTGSVVTVDGGMGMR